MSHKLSSTCHAAFVWMSMEVVRLRSLCSISPAFGMTTRNSFYSFTRQSRMRHTSIALNNFLAALLVGLLFSAASQRSRAQYNYSLLHSFSQFVFQDGAYPTAGLVLGSNGNLFGTAPSGGLGGGTVYEITRNGAYSLLHSFSGADGGFPLAGVTFDNSGNLFGTTQDGGLYGFNNGTVYEIDHNGSFSLLHSFSGPDGLFPASGLIMDRNGNLFGTTVFGGVNGKYGGGTAYEIDHNGSFSLLHSFGNGEVDSAYPYGGLTLDNSGNLFGTTAQGGAHGYGTIFELVNNISNIISSVKFTYGAFYNRLGSSTFVQQVTITNISGTKLTGPFKLVISGLTPGLTLLYPAGITVNFSAGSPYVTVGGGSLNADAKITVFLSFNDPPPVKPINYTPVLLAGSGTP